MERQLTLSMKMMNDEMTWQMRRRWWGKEMEKIEEDTYFTSFIEMRWNIA